MMSKRICRVVSQTEAVSVPTKSGDTIQKCYLRLKEIGSDYADEFNCAVLGNLAQTRYQKGEVVAVALRFRVNEREGNLYQDITATDIVRVKG